MVGSSQSVGNKGKPLSFFSAMSFFIFPSMPFQNIPEGPSLKPIMRLWHSVRLRPSWLVMWLFGPHPIFLLDHATPGQSCLIPPVCTRGTERAGCGVCLLNRLAHPVGRDCQVALIQGVHGLSTRVRMTSGNLSGQLAKKLCNLLRVRKCPVHDHRERLGFSCFGWIWWGKSGLLGVGHDLGT